MIVMLLSVFALLATACSSPAKPADHPAGAGAHATAEAPDLRDAERKLRSGDAYAALDVTDAILRARPEDRDARLLAAAANVQLAQSGVKNADQFLETAARQYEFALDLDRKDPAALIRLAQVRRLLGRFNDGRDAALEAAGVSGDRRQAADALLEAAANEMQLFVTDRNDELQAGTEKPSDSVVRQATGVIARLHQAEQAGASPGVTHKRTADVLRWMGRHSDALKEYETAVAAAPDSNEANTALQEVWWQMGGHVECVGAYKRMTGEAAGNATLRFYLGRAQVALGDRLRREGDTAGAIRNYSEALDSWARYDAARPADHDLSTQWVAICELSVARCALESGDTKVAEEHYLKALAADARVAQFDEEKQPRIVDSFGGNYLGGLAMIGARLSNAEGDHALRDTLDFWQRVITRHPDAFGIAYNNAALAARDLGVKIAGPDADDPATAGDAERQARLAEAMKLWEQSYAWYRKAVELEPQDPRIVNDCGLMLLYHLHRDYEAARGMFERAVELGTAQLAELAKDADASQREFLEEATGDALQNLGVLAQKNLHRPVGEWKPYFEKAVGYFPYQRREAARELARLAGGAPADQDKPDPRKAKFDAELKKADAFAADGDFDSALNVLDALNKEMTGYAPYHYWRGLYSLRFAQQAAKRNDRLGTADSMFANATTQLQRAVELDDKPLEPRRALAESQLVRGLYAEATRSIDDLLSHARSVGGAKPEELLAAHKIRAEAAARAYIDTQQSTDAATKQKGSDLLAAARESMQAVDKAGQLDTGLRDTWISAERWAGANAQAIAIMVRAWQGDASAIGALVDLGSQIGDSGAVLEALQKAEDATSLWWRGRASFDLAIQQWAAGKSEDGVATLDRAIGLFGRSMEVNREFANSCEQWTALCLGQKGIIQTSRDDLDGAETSLVAAMEKRPDVFTNDLGNDASIRRAVLVLADRFFQKGDLGRTAALYRVAGRTAPNDVDIANNEGLFCRDHGERVARKDEKAARELFEASYAAYQRAVKLDGENTRLLNDCALMLVHYLDRDADTAQAMLEKAVKIGDEKLKNDPPADAGDKRNLEEAVGDAYGNLGRLFLRMKKDLPKARAAYEKSLEYYPFQRREGTRALGEIEELEKKGDGK
ncbi:MAG: hypothetical protein U1F36_12535 [Planctomycetota bacterium]